MSRHYSLRRVQDVVGSLVSRLRGVGLGILKVACFIAALPVVILCTVLGVIGIVLLRSAARASGHLVALALDRDMFGSEDKALAAGPGLPVRAAGDPHRAGLGGLEIVRGYRVDEALLKALSALRAAPKAGYCHSVSEIDGRRSLRHALLVGRGPCSEEDTGAAAIHGSHQYEGRERSSGPFPGARAELDTPYGGASYTGPPFWQMPEAFGFRLPAGICAKYLPPSARYLKGIPSLPRLSIRLCIPDPADSEGDCGELKEAAREGRKLAKGEDNPKGSKGSRSVGRFKPAAFAVLDYTGCGIDIEAFVYPAERDGHTQMSLFSEQGVLDAPIFGDSWRGCVWRYLFTSLLPLLVASFLGPAYRRLYARSREYSERRYPRLERLPSAGSSYIAALRRREAVGQRLYDIQAEPGSIYEGMPPLVPALRDLPDTPAEGYRYIARSDTLDHAPFAGARLSGAAMRGVSLKYASLYRAVIAGADLRDSSPEYADLSWVSAEYVRLDGSNLSGITLDGADLTNAGMREVTQHEANLRFPSAHPASPSLRSTTLTAADLSEARLEYVNLYNASGCGACLSNSRLNGADMRRSVWRGAQAEGATLEHAALAGADMSEAIASGASFAKARMPGIRLRGADLSRAILKHAQAGVREVDGLYMPHEEEKDPEVSSLISGPTDLRDCDLRQADLSEARLRRILLDGSDMRRAYLREAFLGEASMRGCNLRKADMYRASLPGADLTGSDLRDVGLREGSLSGAVLRGCSLEGVDLTLCDLRGADLRGATGIGSAHIEEADMRDAEMDNEQRVLATLKGARME